MAQVIDKDINFKSFEKVMKALKNKVIKVGVHSDAGTNEEGELISDYAHANEYGLGVPERSFMRSTEREKGESWQKLMNKIIDKALVEDIDINQHLGLVGTEVTNDIKEKISSNIPPPNSKETIARKKSSKTLIDTGTMRRSITYEVEG